MPKLPIQIEAANYDKGGEGLAFHVQKPTDHSIHRKAGVPIIASTDAGGGYAIQGLQAGDWLACSVDAGEGGMFNVSARVESTGHAMLHLLSDLHKDMTSIEIPAGDHWMDVPGSNSFYLGGGQIITVRIVEPGMELSHMTFTRVPRSSLMRSNAQGSTSYACLIRTSALLCFTHHAARGRHGVGCG